MILAGRGRWKIENEGFNNQKNEIYRIEHLNSKNSNAMKNHYLLTQIADILMQLYVAWNPYIKELKQTIKNTSSWLLESFRRLTVTSEDVSYILRYITIYIQSLMNSPQRRSSMRAAETSFLPGRMFTKRQMGIGMYWLVRR